MLLEKVRKTVLDNDLLSSGDKVLCAVSGGADSVCLLHTMLRLKEELNLTVYVANVNHLIRGEESDEDSDFVKAICNAADVKCFYREFDIPRLAKELKMGEEECGRVKRYEFFEEIAATLDGAKIATAHNLNDNAETVLFRLARGTSAKGISGIKLKRDNIIRPLLEITRNEIEEYLKKYSIQWRNDSSNEKTIYARNKIRINVLPALSEVSEGAEKKIVNAARLISEDNEFLNRLSDELLEKSFVNDYVDVSLLLNAGLPVLRRAVGSLLNKWKTKEVTYEKIEHFIEFLKKDSGAEFVIDKERFVKKAYNNVYLCEKNKEKGFYYTVGKDCIIENDFWRVEIKTSNENIRKKSNNCAVFDAELIAEKIVIRSRKDGDRIFQKGLGGTKKISDIFSDEKVPFHLRDNVPIIEADGEIIFVCGLRQTQAYLPDEKTRNFLVVNYIQKG